MLQLLSSRWLLRYGIVGCLCWLAWAGIATAPGLAGQPPAGPDLVPQVLSIDDAVRWALENNPELAALRQQHGIAAAGVVIAQTYPFNPVWEGKVRAANGPESAGITNRVSNEHKFLIDVEVRHQGRYRREGAGAALSRVDWEIASQEVELAIRVVRAFNTVLYRQEKLRLLEEIIVRNEQDAEEMRKLVEQGKQDAEDLILARIELDDSRAQVGPGQIALATALSDLRRALGVVNAAFTIQGTLESPPQQWDANVLTQKALDQRAELHARQAALREAEARLRLEIANRNGNPNIGPAYEYDPTRINLIGAQITLPLPLFNTKKGEIAQREAERTHAALELRQTETQIRQDVQAALVRLEKARAGQRTYQTQLFPRVRARLEDIERLRNKDKVDVSKLNEARRKLLKIQDDYLDALWEVAQAEADLAAALGDPALVIAPYTPAQGCKAAVAPAP
jgi:cobalt-zinc-cadmium efflux system outer membrane protein